MTDLIIPVKGVYWHQIKAGTKLEEYRLCTPYWTKRLVGRDYARVVLTLGYPKAEDASRRLTCFWQAYTIKTIQHEHFGPDPVTVFAIHVRGAT